MSRTFGYIRVSSKKQLLGNGLEVQKEAILNKYPHAEIVEEQYTGKTTDRPEFNDLIKELQEGDRLVVHKLDRFARTTLEGMNLMNELLKKGIIVEVLNFGTVDGGFSSNNKLMMQIMFAFAEYERDCIVERTQSGKEIAKQDPNFKEGRPQKHSNERIEKALSMLTINGGTMSYNEVADLTKISRSTLIRENNKRRVKGLDNE